VYGLSKRKKDVPLITAEFAHLMYLFACGSHGILDIACDQDINWEKLLVLANQQTVSEMIAAAITRSNASQCPAELKIDLVNCSKAAMMRGYVKKVRTIAMLERFDNAGIRAAVLKGFAVAREYAAPEGRISVDTDILISPSDEQKAVQFLRENGFQMNKRTPQGHHTVCMHPLIGQVELHISLYEKLVEEAWFGFKNSATSLLEPMIPIQSDEGRYYTLGHTDNLTFLAMHLIKHFIIGGTSLRMMMDFALYYKKHKTEVNRQYFWDLLDKLKYKELINTILGAMICFCKFSQDDFPGMGLYNTNNVDVFLNDLEVGGCMGVNDKLAREEGWGIYNREKLIANGNLLLYKLYMWHWNLSNFYAALFPPRRLLESRYPYTKKNKFLLPVAWTQRLFTRGSARLFTDEFDTRIVKNEERVSQGGRERVAMFRKLGML
jgi:hypothetical protein